MPKLKIVATACLTTKYSFFDWRFLKIGDFALDSALVNTKKASVEKGIFGSETRGSYELEGEVKRDHFVISWKGWKEIYLALG